MGGARDTGKVYVKRFSNEYLGTAWLCGRSFLLTAAHVVGERASRKLHPGPAIVEFEWGALAATVTKVDFDLDVALLEPAYPDRLPADVQGLILAPLPRSLRRGRKGRTRWGGDAFGYAAAHESGLGLSGTIDRPSGIVVDGQNGLMQLLCNQGGFGMLGGASGSAVCILGRAVGIIRWAPEALAQRVIIATPLELVAQKWPEIAAALSHDAPKVLAHEPTVLLEALCKIGAPVFALVVFDLKIAVEELQPDNTPLVTRALELVRRYQPEGENGLIQLASAIERRRNGLLAAIAARKD